MNMHLTPMRVESVRTSRLNIPLVRPHVATAVRTRLFGSIHAKLSFGKLL